MSGVRLNTPIASVTQFGLPREHGVLQASTLSLSLPVNTVSDLNLGMADDNKGVTGPANESLVTQNV